MLKGGSVLKSLVKAFGFIAGLALCGAVYAVGMGGINVTSALGEPLKAEIELVAVGKAEKGNLIARLASADAFKSAGMDYPAGLPKLKFQVETRANGESYLGVASAQPVNEPFVSVLIELSWSSGKLLREYTFLLDPPDYKPEQPKAAEVKPVLSKVEGPVEPTVAERQYQREWAEAVKSETAPMLATAPVEEKALAETAPATRKPAESGNVASGVIKVKRGDTLSGIALQAKPSGVSLERMLVALYRANADAFDAKNMNRLKTGKILHMPEQPELGKLTQIEAVKEFRAQVADWHAYRQKLAAASGAGTEQTPKQEVSGKISASIAEKSPAAKEPAKEVVRLSKGEAPGDKAVASGNAKAMQDRIHTLEEESIAKGNALKESNERVAMLEKNIKEMQRLIELKGQPAALAKPVQGKGSAEVKPEPKPEPAQAAAAAKPPAPVAAQPPVTPAIAAARAVGSASAVKPAKPAKPTAAPKVVAPQPTILDNPLYLAGGAAALLALGGLGFMLVRRGKGSKAEKEKAPAGGEAAADIGSTTGRISAPVTPSPETGDFTQGVTPVSPVQVDEGIDPISEADLFLNFGRDAQAEEILKEALEKNPANNRARLKLLSIYANRKDTNSFSVIARQIEASGDAAAWVQAAEMGRNLEPGNPMYGGTGGKPVVAATVDQGKSEPQPAAGLDFDLGFGAPEKAATTGSESTVAPMDFDVSANFNSPVAEPRQEAAVTPNLDDLVFDITSSHPSLPAMTEEKAAAKETVDFDLGDISLSMEALAASAPATEVKDAHWHDVATKLDLAKAYQEMGDNAGAREILKEVLAEGDEQQRAAAESIMQHLPA